MIPGGPECDQALFGWVERKGQLGHQLISTSSGVTDEELSYLQRWNLPVSISNVRFKESIRFFRIGSGRYCLNLVKNIGKDQQGREGALLSHFIVMDREALDFTGGDFFSMDVVLLHSVNSIKDLERLRTKDGDFYQLPKVRFTPLKNEIDTQDLGILKNGLSQASLAGILYGISMNMIFPRIRLLVITVDPESKYGLIWALLRLFPLELRYLSQTTSLYNVRDDIPFSISMVSSASREEFPDYSIVSLEDGYVHIPSKNDAVGLLATHVTSLVFSGRYVDISSYRDNFKRYDPGMAAPHRLILSLSDSFLASSAGMKDKTKVALEASEIEPQRDGKYMRLLRSFLTGPGSDSENYRIVSAFYVERIRSVQSDPEALRKVAGRMLDLMLLSTTGVDYLTSVLKDLVNTMKSEAAVSLASCTMERIMTSDVSAHDFSKVMSASEIFMKTFIKRARDGEMPRGGIRSFAMILENMGQTKVLWQYVNGLLDDQPNQKEIMEFINEVFNSEVMEVLGQDRVVRILKRIPRITKGIDPAETREILSSLVQAIHKQPLSTFLSPSQIIDLEFDIAQRDDTDNGRGNNLKEGRT